VTSLALFKSPEQIFQAGQDAVLRGSFQEARSFFETAASKYAKRNVPMSSLSMAYSSILLISQNPTDASFLYRAAQSVNALGDTVLKLGLREVSAWELGREMALLAAESDLLSRRPASTDQHAEKARLLIELATRFRTEVADRTLVVPELFLKQSIIGEAKAIPLSAYAEESLGESLILDNPKSAAEHYQTARILWMQAPS
jgi:hypothetical protein